MDGMPALLAVSGVVLAHLVWIFFRQSPELSGDEPRYFTFATQMLQGFFASEATRGFWNGPGYPLVLLPFAAFEQTGFFAKVPNALAYGGVAAYLIVFFKQQGIRAPIMQVLLIQILLFMHGTLSEKLMSEPLAAFCVTGFFVHCVLMFQKESETSKFGPSIHAASSGFYLGWLMLTKVLFAYVALAWWGFTLALFFLKRPLLRELFPRPARLLPMVTLVVILPYLTYTYHHTGKFFYWGNSGGQQLFCLTLPQSQLRGDWLNSDAMTAFPEFFGELSPFFESLNSLDYGVQDSILKDKALANIRKHPIKFLQNVRANATRMIFGFPVSAYPGAAPELKTGNRSLAQGLWAYLLLFIALMALVMRRLPHLVGLAPQASMALWAFPILGLSASVLLSTEPRLIFPLLPMIYALSLQSLNQGLWRTPVTSRAFPEMASSHDIEILPNARGIG